METNIDYNAVLADLKAKREKLDAAIAGIETMLGLKASEGQTATTGNTADALRPGAFLGMSIVDATVRYLKAARQNQRNEDIVNALRNGGIVFTAENPVNTVGSVLHRNWTQGGEIVRVSRGVWGLAEWHPRLRRRPDSAEPNEDESEGATNGA